MIELERIEAHGYRRLFERGAGAEAAVVGGAVCIGFPAVESTMLNRATPVEEAVDVEEIDGFFRLLGVRYAVAVTAERTQLADELRDRGFLEGYGWMKFARPADEPPLEAETDLRVEEVTAGQAEALALVECEAYSMPLSIGGFWHGAFDAAGVHAFLAWAGDEPAAAGLVYVDGGHAWLGAAGTRPAFRRRGGQGAIMAARIRRAVELGAHTLVTETGERVEERPSNSYRNILRHGFREQYLRPNWISPA